MYNSLFECLSNADGITTEEIPAKTLLLEGGEKAQHLYLIRKGCLRLFFLKEGKDITFQFFFEGNMVASYDSMYYGRPSLFSLECIEKSEVLILKCSALKKLMAENAEVRELYEKLLAERFHVYQQLFLSRIKDTPQQRYEELLREHPTIIQRVPQHYIASYLGITPVSLSRIRNRR